MIQLVVTWAIQWNNSNRNKNSVQQINILDFHTEDLDSNPGGAQVEFVVNKDGFR